MFIFCQSENIARFSICNTSLTIFLCLKFPGICFAVTYYVTEEELVAAHVMKLANVMKFVVRSTSPGKGRRRQRASLKHINDYPVYFD